MNPDEIPDRIKKEAEEFVASLPKASPPPEAVKQLRILLGLPCAQDARSGRE